MGGDVCHSRSFFSQLILMPTMLFEALVCFDQLRICYFIHSSSPNGGMESKWEVGFAINWYWKYSVHLEKFEVWLISSAFEWSNLCDVELYHWFTGSMAWLCRESQVFSSVITQYCRDALPYYILAWQSIHANWKPLCYWMVPSFSLLIISGKLRSGRGESLTLLLHGSRRQRQKGMREFLSERCWETVEDSGNSLCSNQN